MGAILDGHNVKRVSGCLTNLFLNSLFKYALDLPRAKVCVPYNDFRHCISKYILSTWQASFCRSWGLAVLLQAVHEIVLCRARIGHTQLTHSYILKKDPPPWYEHCQCILTVRHILVELNHFAQERNDIFRRRDLVESFRFFQESFRFYNCIL